MTRRIPQCLLTIVVVAGASVATFGETPAAHWPQFRGPDAGGQLDGANPPLTWNVETGENIRWKTAIPGLGYSSPVVWGDRIFLTTAVPVGKDDDPQVKVGLYGNIMPVNEDYPQRFQVLCLDRNTGETLWTQTAHEGVPKVKRHPKASHANSTPATDGEHVVACFGSEGLYCYDVEGNLKWKKDLGYIDSTFFMVPAAQWGFAASPIIHDGKVFVQCDGLKKQSDDDNRVDPFVAAFDITDGREIWRTPHDDVPTWSSPALWKHATAGEQIVVNGWKHIGGYDAATGKEIWRMDGGGDIPVPTPVFGDELIYITNAHGRAAPLFAVRATAEGDITLGDDTSTNDYVAWSTMRNGAYMQTPLLVGDLLFSCRDNGGVMCYDAMTGERYFAERLGGGQTGFTASPVAAAGRLYFTAETGDVVVIKADKTFEKLAANAMNDVCMATPALLPDGLLVRTQHNLYSIGGK